MEEPQDVKALEKISHEVDESQIKVILSSQCIKAQAFLLDKLKKQSERHKETCSFISSANLKVQTEIKQAEQEIQSMLIAQETIKSANVEIKKDWLLAKTKKADVTERVSDGIKRYEALWIECKTRYESIPFVQKLLQAKEKQKNTTEDIDDLDKQITKLYDDKEERRKSCAQLDRNRCLELASFMVNERPKAITMIKEKSKIINGLNMEIEQLLKQQDKHDEAIDITTEVTEPLNLNASENIKSGEANAIKDVNLSKTDDDPLIPKLNLVNFDLDIIDVNLDQVKMKKEEILSNIPTRTNSMLNDFEKQIEQRLENEKAYDYMISPYFKPFKEGHSRSFSDRKLINILEDINVNKGEAYNIVKKVNPEQLKVVSEISAEPVEDVVMQSFRREKDFKQIINENIEEIELASSNADHILIPPTQFLDLTLSDEMPRKRVSFELPSSMQIKEIIDDEKQGDDEEIESANQTVNSQLDVSAASDDSYKKIKEMLLKKHNLELSPQFVYAKNSVLQKKTEDNIVTSKFFNCNLEETKTDNNDIEMEVDDEPIIKKVEEIQKPHMIIEEAQSEKDNIEHNLMAVDEVAASAPQPIRVSSQSCEEEKSERPVSGLLFTHGAQAIPESLNVSLSTTGYEDSDFPHCIDSSLLLSPKADISATGDGQDVMSQEVPNFLSGFRKTGLSFFGGPSTSSDPNPDSSAQNDGNNFNFNFGGEKKSRGGLFSLFR